jgi:hypothetical protein
MGPCITVCSYCRFNALLTLPDGMIGKANYKKPNTLGDVDLNRDQNGTDPPKCTAESLYKHSSLLHFWFMV